jgi:hypothetical protein
MNLVSAFYNTRSSRKFASHHLTTSDIANAKKIVISCFNRYGEFFANIKIIKEMLAEFGDKEIMFIIPHHFVPYAKHFFGSQQIIGVNKRNPIDVVRTIAKLRTFNGDIGFNPWSYGGESEFFISYTKKFAFYTNYISQNQIRANTDNFYDQLRAYMLLSAKKHTKEWQYQKFNLQSYNKILICPESSEKNKTIPADKLNILCDVLHNTLGSKELTLATTKPLHSLKNDEKNFIVKKSYRSSKEFLELMQGADLVVSVDAGPLHLAHIMQKDIIAIFSVNPPQCVLDYDSRCIILREPSFGIKQCKNDKICKRPLCIDTILNDNLLTYNYINQSTNFDDIIVMRSDECIYG